MRLSAQTWVAALSMAVSTACATQPRDTWDRDRVEGIRADGSAPARATTPPAPTAPRRLSMQAPDPAEVAYGLEMALLRFTARRRALSREQPPGPGPWPMAILRAWQAIVHELEDGFGAASSALPSRLLVQTRVTLEAELELTVRRHGPAPERLAGRVLRLYVEVATGLRTHRARRPGRGSDAAPSTEWLWPVSPLVVTSPFGFRRDPILGETRVRFHAGVDLGGRRGDLVVAAGQGRVVGAGWKGGHGRTITVQHPGGYTTRYAHLSRILVELGTEVDAGSPLGLMGSSGRSTGPHLHFEVRRGSVPVDPFEWVGSRSAPYAAR